MVAQRFDRLGTASDFLRVWLTTPLLPADLQRRLHKKYANWRRLESERLRFWYDQQLADIEAARARYAKPRILEIGVGRGTECLWLAMNGAEVTGIDRNGKALEMCRARRRVLEAELGRRLDIRLEQIPVLQFDDRQGFDIVWLEQTFHHLEPRAEVVPKLARLLRPGGTIILQEANAWNPLLQLQLFRQRGFDTISRTDTPDGPQYYGKERILVARRLVRHLRGQGIEPQSLRYFRVFPSTALFDRFFGLERHLSRHFGWGPFVALFTHYNLVGIKRR